jgi:hypothetical protein
MPETIDFNRVARRIMAESMPTGDSLDSDIEDAIEALVDELRKIWNARGAADLATIEAQLSSTTGAGPYIQNLNRALRTLDR